MLPGITKPKLCALSGLEHVQREAHRFHCLGCNVAFQWLPLFGVKHACDGFQHLLLEAMRLGKTEIKYTM